MAEQIPYDVATSIVNRLASAAFRELGKIYGVVDELERLNSTVKSIKAVLLDAEERQEREHAVQLWITRLKEVLHPADDLLDEFSIEDMRHKLDSGRKSKLTKVFHSISPKRIAFRYKMAHQIEKVQNNFNDVVQDMSKLNFSPRTVVVKQTDIVTRETASFVLKSDIIGREHSKKEIIYLLRQPNKSQNISLVAIVGIGGLGKTALAQLVYNDVEVENIFEKKMWVCVSDNFDVKNIVRKMFESLTKCKIDEKLSLDNLQNMIRDTLSGKKFLLVLDDTWNENLERWTQFKSYLMCGAEGSKVLVTTRSKIVAQTMGVNAPYVLDGLIEEESWRVLKKITFGDDTIRVNQTLESIGKKIAEKCRGVPLAVRTLGGLLQSKSKESEWRDVLEGDFWKLCEEEESIIPVLKLSYQNLSPEMRQCFAFCSLYPKDWEIEKDELIELWMAQGYLESSDENQLMEDVGNQFVKVFLKKSFFQDVKMSEHGDVSSFKMHDLMHDLATQIAGNDCCRLEREVRRVVGRPMHAWLGQDAVALLDSLDPSRLRTLILKSASKLSEKQLSFISNFKYLRSLSLSYDLRHVPCSIGKLKHLSYPCLPTSDTIKFESLHKSISNLVCLQTLRFCECLQLESPRNIFSKLINLRHLYVRGIDISPMQYFAQNLQEKLGRETIYLNCISSITNIVEISMVGCRYVQNISPLERLSFLKLLKIDSLGQLEYITFDDFHGGTFFPSLESLIFRKCYKLRGWCRMGDDFDNINYLQYHLSLPSFPRLSYLSNQNCRKLICMPTFPNLDKTLLLRDCRGEPLEATLNMATASGCSVDLIPLSNLSFLCVDGGLLEQIKLQIKWMKNLTSLQYLQFLSISVQALREMEMCFKDDLYCFPSLKKFVISFTPELRNLPDWICNLSSLQHIKIVGCHNLATLPEAMPRLTNLQTLDIIDCPCLIEECKNETSAERHKIAHIPIIMLK